MRACPKSWIETYQEYTLNQESPDLFHLWVAVSMISSALGRRVWLGQDKIYPNHYVCLVGSTALCRKSTSIRIGWGRILDKAKVCPMSAERITNAALLQMLGSVSEETGSAELLIIADELKMLLSGEEAYKGVATTLTRLYTCPDYYENRTKGKGVDVLHNACVNILAATTPRDFQEIMPSGSTDSGFVPRWHIVFQKYPRDPKPWPSVKEEYTAPLIADLKHIRYSFKGEFTLTPGAKEWYERWYAKMARPEEDKLDGFYGRKHTFLLKLGMVLATSERDGLLIHTRDLRKSLEMLDQIETFLPEIYEEVDVAPALKYKNHILRKIASARGGIPYGALLRAQGGRVTSKELGDVLNHLIEEGRIERVTTARAMIYKLKSGG